MILCSFVLFKFKLAIMIVIALAGNYLLSVSSRKDGTVVIIIFLQLVDLERRSI